MPIVAECGDCKKQYKLDGRMAGKRVKCKQCGNVFTVPGELAAGASLAGGTLSGTVAGRSASVAGRPTIEAHPARPAASPKAPSSARIATPPPPPPAGADDALDFDALFNLGEGAPVDVGPVAMAPPPIPSAGAAPFASPAPAFMPAPAAAAHPPGVGYYAPPAPRRKKITAVGVDSATPWMIICYVVANVALLVYMLVEGRKGTAPVAWTLVTTNIVSLFAVIGPLVLLGVFIGSRILNFDLQDAAYLRSCGIGAIPGVMSALAILIAITSGNPVVIGLLLLATLPLFFYVLKMSFDLSLPEALVSFAFCVVFYGIAQFLSFLLITAVAAGAAMGAGGRGVGDDDDAVALDDRPSRPSNPSPPPSYVPPAAPAPPADPLASEAKSLRDRVYSLGNRNVTGRSREMLMGEWRGMKLAVDAARPRLGNRPEWAEINDLLTTAEQKFQALPSENPDPSLFQAPQATENWETSASEAAALGPEVSFRNYRFRPPLEAPLDLKTGGAGDPAGLAWRHRKSGSTTLAVSVAASTDPRQRRPWVATEDFMVDAAARNKLFAVNAVGAAPQVSYGRIGGIAFTRVASNPSAGTFVQRWVKYVALDRGNWLVIEIHGQKDDFLTADLMETAAKSLRQAQAGEARADPFAPQFIAPRLVDDPERAVAILRRHGAAAEPAVVAQLEGSDARAQREAARLLLDLGTAASVPALTKAASAPDGELAKAARAALRKITPSTFDAVSEAMLDLRDERGWRKKEALAALASARPDAARRAQVATLLEDMIVGDKAGFDAELAGQALAVWYSDKTVTKLTPILLEEHGNMWKRKGAIAALAGTKDKRAAVTILRWIVKEPEAVTKAVMGMGPVAEDEILRLNLLRNADAKVRANAATMLEQVGSGKSYQELLRASKDARDASAAAVAQQALESVKARMAAPKPVTKPAG